MNEQTKWILDRVLGGGGVVIIAWILKYVMDTYSTRLNDFNIHNQARFTDVYNRLTNIESKYNNVLDIVLEKFSRWEDKLLKIVEQSKEMTPEKLKEEIAIFKNLAADDIKSIRLEVERVSVEVKKIEPPVIIQDKEFINKKLRELDESVDARLGYIDQTLENLYKIQTSHNIKLKEHEFKINNLVATRK